jgi:hypothetical protein
VSRALTTPDEVTEEIHRLGAVDVVVGLPTVGATPTAAALAQAARAALDGRLAGHYAVLVHADPTPSEETAAQLAEALGTLPLLRLADSGLPSARVPGETADVDEGVRTVLEVGRRLGARAVIVLDPALAEPVADDVAALVEPALKEDHGLVLPCFDRSRHEGTLTHALVVPLVRALFGRRLAYPLAREFACSGTGAASLLETDVWGTDLARQGLEFWIPVAALVHGLVVSQALVAPRTAPPGRPSPLGPTVGRVAGSLFGLAERYEAAWLDVRDSADVPMAGRAPEIREGSGAPDPERMLAGFRLGVRDLLTVWERILAPENLAEILDLSDAGIEDFRLPDPLWARVVYDFLLGYRFRVVYRTHLVQSLAPLYLGRAASVMLENRGRPPAAVGESAGRLAREFEREKGYVVERWA